MITGEIFPTKVRDSLPLTKLCLPHFQFRSAAVTVSIFVSWFLLLFVSLLYLPFKQVSYAGASTLAWNWSHHDCLVGWHLCQFHAVRHRECV